MRMLMLGLLLGSMAVLFVVLWKLAAYAESDLDRFRKFLDGDVIVPES